MHRGPASRARASSMYLTRANIAVSPLESVALTSALWATSAARTLGQTSNDVPRPVTAHRRTVRPAASLSLTRAPASTNGAMDSEVSTPRWNWVSTIHINGVFFLRSARFGSAPRQE